MNLLGKTIVILIMVFAVGMTVATTVLYMTPVNHRKKIQDPDNGYLVQIKKLNEKIAELQVQNDSLTRDVNEERQLGKHIAAALDTRNAEQASTVRKAAELPIQQITIATNNVLTLMSKYQLIQDLSEKVQSLAPEIYVAMTARDVNARRLTQALASFNNAVMQQQQLNARYTALLNEKSQQGQVLQMAGLGNMRTTADYQTWFGELLPNIKGVVETIYPQYSGGGMAKISIGSDDWVRPGMELEVVRRGQSGGFTYVGRVKVTQVQPDWAFCKPVLLRTPIMRGDGIQGRNKSLLQTPTAGRR